MSQSLERSHLSLRCTQSLSGESLFTKGLCTFLSGDFRLLSEMGEFVHGPFKSRLFFLLCSIAFLGVSCLVLIASEATYCGIHLSCA